MYFMHHVYDYDPRVIVCYFAKIFLFVHVDMACKTICITSH